MFQIRLADLGIEVVHQYDYIKNLCQDYLWAEEPIEFCVSSTEEDIEAENDGNGLDRGYLESLAVYRKIAERLPFWNRFLMHGVVIDVGGTGVAFLAKSGTGKTTHAWLWKNFLGHKVTFVNGDKPLVYVNGDRALAYGTPWAGKENLHSNISTPLKNICFIERDAHNQCIPLPAPEGLIRLLPQIYRPDSEEMRKRTFELAASLAENVSFYALKCNMDISAAQVAYEDIMK